MYVYVESKNGRSSDKKSTEIKNSNKWQWKANKAKIGYLYALAKKNV